MIWQVGAAALGAGALVLAFRLYRRALSRLAVVGFVLLLVSGCALIPQKRERVTRRQACQQALEQGWCYDDCRRQPVTCCEPRDVHCGDVFCVWKGCDGALVFSVRP